MVVVGRDEHAEARNRVPFSQREARWVATALFAYPLAVAIFDLGIVLATEREPLNPLTFAGFALIVGPALVLFFAIIRIAGRPGKSVGGTIFEFALRAPLGLVFARYGRQTFERAAWSYRWLWLQRALWVGVMILHVGVIVDMSLGD